jgi:hypothetical protein
MKAEDTNKYQKERDIPVLLDSLQELFQERGDTVTPTDLAQRMEEKLHRHISPMVASYLYTTLGFVSSQGITSFPMQNYSQKDKPNSAKLKLMNLTKTNNQINLMCSIGSLNLMANLYFEEDTAAMLYSLLELFQENGDKVTATLIAERMESKLHRHIHHHRAAYLYRLLGFYSTRGKGHDDRSKYYVVPDYNLLARCRVQYCNIDIKDK